MPYKDREKKREREREWSKRNPDKKREYFRRWYINLSEEQRNKKCERDKVYRKNHPEKWSEYMRKRRREDIQFRLADNLRGRLGKALRNKYKAGSAVRDLGCSIAQLKFWLSYQFQPGMTWDNYGEWYIDHVKPLSSFDLTDREQFLEACNWYNLQPLWAEENSSKGNNCG